MICGTHFTQYFRKSWNLLQETRVRTLICLPLTTISFYLIHLLFRLGTFVNMKSFKTFVYVKNDLWLVNCQIFALRRVSFPFWRIWSQKPSCCRNSSSTVFYRAKPGLTSLTLFIHVSTITFEKKYDSVWGGPKAKSWCRLSLGWVSESLEKLCMFLSESSRTRSRTL